MKSTLLFTIATIILTSCSSYQEIPNRSANEVLDQWHRAAANANFDSYFNLMTKDAVFIGTDATENWQVEEFKAYAKPYFDKGKAWSFTPLERNVYSTNGMIYFDELLSTQMGICRGSGVLKLENGQPRIAHYVLSIAVPNENVDVLTEMKGQWDATYTTQLQSKRTD